MEIENLNNNKKKLCAVCGDDALGFNFNALTCVSCKAFFRRNAYRETKYVCKNGGKCRVDKYCRIKCKKCRINKCISIGMKKELIAIRSKNPLCTIANDNSICLYREDWQTRKHFTGNGTIDPLRVNEIQMIQQANNAMSIFPNDSAAEITGLAKNILEFYNIPGTLTDRVVRYCKSFVGFSTLKENDQLLLLKSFFTQIMCVRYAFQFDIYQDGIPMIYNEEDNKAIFIKSTIYDKYNKWKEKEISKVFREYHYSLYREMEKDEIIRNLIIAQLLFKVHSESITCPEYLRYKCHVYRHLLERYLSLKYNSPVEARLKCENLENILNDISVVTDTVKEVFENLEQGKVQNVLCEIYDLNDNEDESSSCESESEEDDKEKDDDDDETVDVVNCSSDSNQ